MNAGEAGASIADDGFWMVEAIIQPFKLDAVARALESVRAFSGMTVTEARGFGSTKVQADRERSGGQQSGLHFGADVDSVTDFSRKIRLEVVVVGKANADMIIAVIMGAARTGNQGDGKVFVWPLSGGFSIRAGTAVPYAF